MHRIAMPVRFRRFLDETDLDRSTVDIVDLDAALAHIQARNIERMHEILDGRDGAIDRRIETEKAAFARTRGFA